MERSGERSYLWLVEDLNRRPSKLPNIRSKIKSLMEKVNASIGYTHSNGENRCSFEKIFPDGILSFPFPHYTLRDVLDQLEDLEYAEGNFPPVIHVYERLRHPSNLELVK